MKKLTELIQEKILLLDGGMGTQIQDMNLTDEDFGGKEYVGCNEYLVISKPDCISKIHEAYLKAGADIIQTNTFGGTALVLEEYGLGKYAYEINYQAAQLAKKACDLFQDQEKFVAGSVGPTTKSLSVTGGITFDELTKEFQLQCDALIAGGVDYLLFETALDTLNLKAAYLGALKAFENQNKHIPIAISGTIETMGTMLAGQGVEALYTSVEHINPLYVGLNCATGPEFMKDHIRTLSQISKFPVSVVPNAGIPNADGLYPETPEMFAKTIGQFLNQGWLNVIGGCCGTTPAHIKALRTLANQSKPRRQNTTTLSRISGIEALVLEDENRPYIIGERSNVIGSKAFKELITQEKFDEAGEIVRKQVKAGANIIDVCLSNPDRDEVKDMTAFLEKASKMTKAPFMIDSQVPEVVEAAFKLIQGKCILNSVNLEDGEKSLSTLLPLVKQYGASVVVGCIKEEMAITAEEKLAYATDAYEIITKKYGILPEDIIFDPLVFPCGTGDEKYFGSGKHTIEGVRLIKEKYPQCKTTLGISNVSFGLPAAGREVLNSVFLYLCSKAGLDTAIVNSEKLVRYANISEEEKKLCEALLYYNHKESEDPIADFVAYFRDKKTNVEIVDRSALSIEKKLEINIVQGTKEFLIENLDEALKKWVPLDVINVPLMAAMDIVGKMFNNNELIVAEVLQSAEVMKTAVQYLEQFMEKAEKTSRAKILLATVKGDVHDIGKNLVQIILSNNGYDVIDLGIKCPPEVLIEAYHRHQPDIIGLSGLLVKSAQQMITTAEDLKTAGIHVPILVGGAALTESFTISKIAPTYEGAVIYCKDAMTGLEIANQLSNKDLRKNFIEQVKSKKAEQKVIEKPKRSLKTMVFDYENLKGKAPHFNPIIETATLEEIWPYMNKQMVYGHHLGIKGNITSLIEKGDEKVLKIEALLNKLKKKIQDEALLTAKAIYQFFKVKVSQNDLIILNPTSLEEIQRFSFPRQDDSYQLCLTDFVHPHQIDEVCFFVLTAGDGIAKLAKEFLEKGDYFESHGLSAIALEAAEGFAERLHQKIRKTWGIPDPETLSIEDLYKLKYTGVRVSFGYPACPNLEDQGKLWTLLRPDQTIGVTLSEEFMMDPEASVSALVFRHPQARYFSI